MSQPFKLFRLQQIDSQLDRARTRRAEIEAALAEDEAVRAARQSLEAAEKALQKERKALREAEQIVRDQRNKIEQTESSLYGGRVRNPKELQDMQKEAASLKRYLGVLEDRQLEAMLATEECEAASEAAKAELAEKQGEFDQRHVDLLAQQATLSKEIENWEAERLAAASAIPPEDMTLYDQLRKTRRGVAVAKVSNNACAACGTTLSAALLHASRSPNTLNRCETCGRILYAG